MTELANIHPVKGDRFRWLPLGEPVGQHVTVTVTRVARDGSWADIQCQQKVGETPTHEQWQYWSKRQRLPLPETFQPDDRCWWCQTGKATELPCCSSHARDLCKPCYKRLHFVEV